jgi:ParB family chromosome partitioning protein
MTNKILKTLPVDLLFPGTFQPREHFDEEALQRLAQTIQTMGVLEPLLVRPRVEGNFEIIAGERRWRAAQRARLSAVPCLVMTELSDTDVLKIALIENLARENLNPIEEALGIKRLVEEYHYTHEEIATFLGKSRSEVTNLLRLLKLDKRVIQLVREGRLSGSHAKVIAGLPPHEQYPSANVAAANNWSLKTLEKNIEKYKNKKGPQEEGGGGQDAKTLNYSLSAQTEIKDHDQERLQDRIAQHLGTPISIDYRAQHQAGSLHIHFHSLEALEGLLEKMGVPDDE